MTKINKVIAFRLTKSKDSLFQCIIPTLNAFRVTRREMLPLFVILNLFQDLNYYVSLENTMHTSTRLYITLFCLITATIAIHPSTHASPAHNLETLAVTMNGHLSNLKETLSTAQQLNRSKALHHLNAFQTTVTAIKQEINVSHPTVPDALFDAIAQSLDQPTLEEDALIDKLMLTYGIIKPHPLVKCLFIATIMRTMVHLVHQHPQPTADDIKSAHTMLRSSLDVTVKETLMLLPALRAMPVSTDWSVKNRLALLAGLAVGVTAGVMLYHYVKTVKEEIASSKREIEDLHTKVEIVQQEADNATEECEDLRVSLKQLSDRLDRFEEDRRIAAEKAVNSPDIQMKILGITELNAIKMDKLELLGEKNSTRLDEVQKQQKLRAESDLKFRSDLRENCGVICTNISENVQKSGAQIAQVQANGLVGALKPIIAENGIASAIGHAVNPHNKQNARNNQAQDQQVSDAELKERMINLYNKKCARQDSNLRPTD